MVDRNTAQRKLPLERIQQRSQWQLLQLQKLLPKSQIPTEGCRDSRDLERVLAARRTEVSSASAEVKRAFEGIVDNLNDCLVQELCAAGSACSYWSFPHSYLIGKAPHVKWMGRMLHIQPTLKTASKVDCVGPRSFGPTATNSLAAKTRYAATVCAN